MTLLHAELVVCRAQIIPLPTFEVCPSQFKEPTLEADHVIVVNQIWSKLSLTIRRLEQPVLDQAAGTNQHGVSRKRRYRLIRRVSVTGGTKRQSLPPCLAGIVETIHPRERRRSQIADSIGRWQRGDVQQQARGTILGRKRRNIHDPAVIGHCRAPEFSASFTISSASLRIAFRCDSLAKLSA